ncbi:MAG: imidazole glycerol phosphate synthase subunit HisH [Leptospirillum sp.]
MSPDKKALTAVLDYGMGNLFSVSKALESSGHTVTMVSSGSPPEEATHLVLPGVGAFAQGMESLVARGFDRIILDWISSGKPFLGICLGMQLLFDESFEFGHYRGLGVFEGSVVGFDPLNGKVPHMGWNQIEKTREIEILRGLPDHFDAYFVHSFHVVAKNETDIAGITDYQGKFTSIVANGPVFGVQFHPEKSQSAGLAILESFAKCQKGEK